MIFLTVPSGEDGAQLRKGMFCIPQRNVWVWYRFITIRKRGRGNAHGNARNHIIADDWDDRGIRGCDALWNQGSDRDRWRMVASPFPAMPRSWPGSLIGLAHANHSATIFSEAPASLKRPHAAASRGLGIILPNPIYFQ